MKRGARIAMIGLASMLAVCILLLISVSRWYPAVQMERARRIAVAGVRRDEKAFEALSAEREYQKQQPLKKVAVRVRDTVEISSSYRECWFPTVHRFSTGQILVTMRMSPDEMDPEGEFSAFTISSGRGAHLEQTIHTGRGREHRCGLHPKRRRHLVGTGSRL